MLHIYLPQLKRQIKYKVEENWKVKQKSEQKRRTKASSQKGTKGKKGKKIIKVEGHEFLNSKHLQVLSIIYTISK